MPMRRPRVFTWMPMGLSDNRAAASANPGDCRVLTNLIHDPTSKGVVAPRAAVVALTNFAGFTSPGVVSVHYVVGSRIYGMLATGRNAGYDEPFCYDTSTSSFVTISGVTSSNVPATPATTGAWTPPCMVLVGVILVVTHPGFAGGANPFFGWFDLTNPAVPVWHAGNTTGAVQLPSVPIACGTFFNRCWFACGNYAIFSDILAATNITNAGQQLVAGDTSAITCLSPQPITTGTQGVLSALLIFKGTSIWQVTGDYSSTSFPLALNNLSNSVGSLAGRSVTPTPNGTLFLASDGIRSVTLLGAISEPQQDVIYPFYNVSPASRAAGDYAADVYRITVTSVNNQGSLGKFDYWYSQRFQRWTGPHSFSYDNVVAFGNTFVLSSNSKPGMLWTSNTFPSSSDTFIEGGTQLTVQMISSPIAPDPPMAEKASVEMEVGLVPSVIPYQMQVLEATGALVSQTTVVTANPPASWGGAITWGQPGLVWGASPYNLNASPVNFPVPLVFKQAVLVFSGQSQLALRLGPINFRYEGLGYTGQD